jgi:hypothetical protein
LPVGQVEAAEATLVQAAHALGPRDLRGLGQRLLDTINPDGPEPDEAELQRKRDVSLTPLRDGMVRLAGLLDPVTGAKALAYLHARSKPRPDDATGRDQRSPAQRRHDAFTDLLDLATRAKAHAADGQPAATAHVLIDADKLAARSGMVSTSFGQRLSVAQALELAGQGELAWIVHHSSGGIISYGRCRRLASKAQAQALIARDRGCAMPGCHIPPEWCERHHIIAWIDGGHTDLDNLVLLCKYHHHRLLQQGWRIEVRDGVPWFIPPSHIDRERKPIRNLR